MKNKLGTCHLILREIVEKFTLEIYREKGRFKALLADYLPHDPRLLRLLSLVIDHGGSLELYRIYQEQGLSETHLALKQKELILKIAELSFVPEETVTEGIDLLWEALKGGGTRQESTTSSPPEDLWEEESSETGLTALGASFCQKLSCLFSFQKSQKSYQQPDTSSWNPRQLEWFRQAQQGESQAQFLLSSCCPLGREEKAYWLLQALLVGHEKSQVTFLMDYFRLGQELVFHNPEMGFDLMLKLAKEGNSEAQYTIAGFYLRGEHTVQNKGEAVVWLEKASKQRHPEACFSLSRLYRFGDGVAQSESKALEYENKGKQYKQSGN